MQYVGTMNGSSGANQALEISSMRVFTAPSQYVQGPGALDRLPQVVRAMGNNPVAVIDAGVAAWLSERLAAILPDMALIPFSGEITKQAADALARRVAGQRGDLVVAIGGGKALDAGKAAALRCQLHVITIPTIASTDAPASRGIALYDDAHRLVAVEQMHNNPACVLVDTALVARAPAIFLLAGIGDAVAKKFEAEACFRDRGTTKHGTRPGQSALAIADGCYRVLRQRSVGALAAMDRQLPDDALEDVVEACLLMSGLGFENGRLHLAHAMTRGLMIARAAADRPHGLHVAYGLLLHLMLDGMAPMLHEVHSFYATIGMPASLAGLGMADPQPAELQAMAAASLSAPSMRNVARPPSIAEVMAAMQRIEALPLPHTEQV